MIDELQRMQVFYVNIGGGEPTVRPDFWELLDYAVAHHVGVKFSTNGSGSTRGGPRGWRRTDYVDVQISLDGATAEVNDAVRGPGSYDTAMRAMENLAEAGFGGLQDLGGDDPAEHRPARRVQGASPTSSARSCGSPGCGRPGAAPTCGTSCTRCRRSSASSTTG